MLHLYMRIHSDGSMCLGKGVAYCTPHKQKIKMNISTKVKVVRVDDLKQQILKTWNFLKAQGITPNNLI